MPRWPFQSRMLAVEDDIPVTPAHETLRVYPWHKLEVGQSFETTIERWASARAAAWKASKKLGIKLTTRVQPNGNLRVWRVE